MRAALRHPLGLSLLGASLAIAAAVQLSPALATWAALAPWIALWGLASYTVLAVAYGRSLPAPDAPELHALRAVRQAIAARLAEQRATGHKAGQTELPATLADTIATLDTQVEPALRRLLRRRAALGDYLYRIELGQLPAPDQPVLTRLQAAHARQAAAIETCVRQAANAAGTLVALLQDEEDTGQVMRLLAWSSDLRRLHDLLVEELDGDDLEQAHQGAAGGETVATDDQTPLSPQTRQRALGLLRERFVAGKIDLSQYEQQVEQYLRPTQTPDH